MDKIICDICGTTYPASSESCPICGCSRVAAANIMNKDVQNQDFSDKDNVEFDVFFKNSEKKGIFDYDEVNSEDSSAAGTGETSFHARSGDEEYYEDEENEEAPRHNTFAVILLTVVIFLLLGAAAFLFLRYFLPNMKAEDTTPTEALQQEMETSDAATEPTVPCQQMAMINAGVAELNAECQQFLLHIKALPENTTDPIIYTSGDETIATVTEDGKITAVSEGETVIYISCGKTSMECPVIVKYVEETVPPTTEATVEETVPAEGSGATEETVPADSSAATEETVDLEETAQPAATEAVPVRKDVTLKLKKTDIQLGVYYSFQLELDCDLTPEEVTWSSEHPHIATVDEQGNVTAVKQGTTSITAKYGEQEVQCIVRCIWY